MINSNDQRSATTRCTNTHNIGIIIQLSCLKYTLQELHIVKYANIMPHSFRQNVSESRLH